MMSVIEDVVSQVFHAGSVGNKLYTLIEAQGGAKNGKVNWTEFSNFLSQCGWSQEEAQAAWYRADRNRSGTLSRGEFLDFAHRKDVKPYIKLLENKLCGAHHKLDESELAAAQNSRATSAGTSGVIPQASTYIDPARDSSSSTLGTTSAVPTSSQSSALGAGAVGATGGAVAAHLLNRDQYQNQNLSNQNLSNQTLSGQPHLVSGQTLGGQHLASGQTLGGQTLGQQPLVSGQTLGGQNLVSGQTLGTQNLANQNLGNSGFSNQTVGGQLVTGQTLDTQTLGSQNLGGQNFVSGQTLATQTLGSQNLGSQNFVSGQSLGTQNLSNQNLVGGQHFVSGQNLGSQNLSNQNLTGSQHLVSGQPLSNQSLGSQNLVSGQSLGNQNFVSGQNLGNQNLTTGQNLGGHSLGNAALGAVVVDGIRYLGNQPIAHTGSTGAQQSNYTSGAVPTGVVDQQMSSGVQSMNLGTTQPTVGTTTSGFTTGQQLPSSQFPIHTGGHTIGQPNLGAQSGMTTGQQITASVHHPIQSGENALGLGVGQPNLGAQSGMTTGQQISSSMHHPIQSGENALGVGTGQPNLGAQSGMTTGQQISSSLHHPIQSGENALGQTLGGSHTAASHAGQYPLPQGQPLDQNRGSLGTAALGAGLGGIASNLSHDRGMHTNQSQYAGAPHAPLGASIITVNPMTGQQPSNAGPSAGAIAPSTFGSSSTGMGGYQQPLQQPLGGTSHSSALPISQNYGTSHSQNILPTTQTQAFTTPHTAELDPETRSNQSYSSTRGGLEGQQNFDRTQQNFGGVQGSQNFAGSQGLQPGAQSSQNMAPLLRVEDQLGRLEKHLDQVEGRLEKIAGSNNSANTAQLPLGGVEHRQAAPTAY